MFPKLYLIILVGQISIILNGKSTNGKNMTENGNNIEVGGGGGILSQFLTPGHWTSWSSWICDAVCGKGKYFRKRVCVSTEDFAIPNCHGLSIERGEKPCRVSCPGIKQLREQFFGPTLPKSLKKVLYETLTSGNDAYERKVGETVQFDCYNIVTVEFLVNYSTSSIYWEKNDNRIEFEPNRMILRDYSILGINNLTLSDTGVYTCNVRLSKSFKKTILLFSLIVLGDPYQFHVTSSSDLKVTCNTKSIGRLFNGLRVQWIVDSSSHVIKDYPPSIPPERVNEDVMRNVKESDTGLWACVVRDNIYNRTWLTNAFYVKVHRNIILTAWRWLHPIAKVILVLVAILITVAICGIATFYAIKIYKRYRERIFIEDLRLILKISKKLEEEEEDEN